MSNKSKQHADHPGQTKNQWLPHKDWRIYLGVALMLVAIFIYLATMDESWRPSGQVDQPLPAASGP